ncbi:ABC transporter substrate-binding protein [Sciscionella sediminilitoris]|uniref:ABC transporter substrate-binding protein n=1 Tax=Sciscionella sediminilitoris TaxID=1445613 RepID=UPI0004DF77EA|nr:ABC transporter substrate-binding protein [Sciscionella sp. SE31]
MTRTARSIRVLLGALVLLLAATGCVNEADGPGGHSGGNRLNISATGTDSLPFMAILQVGIDNGWFAKEGLDVSLYSGGGGGNTLRVLTTGDADLAIAGNTSVVLASRQHSANLTVVAPWFQLNDFHWIAPRGQHPPKPTLGYSSGGSSTELLVRGLQRKLHVDTQAVGGMGDNWTAARAGKITAGWSMQPFTTEKIQQGAQILVNARKVLGDLPADLVAVNNDYAKQKPENLRAFFRVVRRLDDFVVHDTAAAAKALAPLTGVSVPTMTRALNDTPDLAKGYSLRVDPEGLRRLSDLMVSGGLIEHPVDWRTTLDQRYLPAELRTSAFG